MTYADPMETGDRRGTVTDAIYARERRHSSMIRLFRRALPGVAVLVLVVLVARTIIVTFTGVSIDFAGTTIEGGKLVMANPRMGGFTAAKRPYELTAERAIQDIADTESVDLEEITARLPVGDSDWAQVDAATGTLFKEAGILSITSPTLVKTTDGLEARLKLAELNMATGDIRGKEAVEIQSGGSRVTSELLTVTGGGTLMVFENNVKMLIPSRQSATASASVGEVDDPD